MMDTDTPKPWAQSRLPYAHAVRARLTAPVLPRDQPYLGTLPVIITAALLFMAASGFVLSLFYNPADGYNSIQFIDRNVNYGWLIHGFHATGTTMIFGAVYLYLFRAMFNRDYQVQGKVVWLLSIAQFVLLLLVGYLGYLLTDGAMSYWSLANSAAAAGGLGGFAGAAGSWLFGGPAGPGTLARMAVFHTTGALAIFGILWLNRLAKKAVAVVPEPRRRISFHPYYTAQYFTAFVIFMLIFAVLVFFLPHLGENPLNRSAANALLLPMTISPPWYLLAIAGIRHFLPGSLGGMIAMVAGLAVLFALPWLDRSVRGKKPGGWYRLLVVLLGIDVILISIAAASQPSMLGGILLVVFTAYYFLHFIVLTPLVTFMEPG